ncbi:hypothetical protein P171DRAFT_449832 [Karstenula rhodostoma CBS 690.94]|uniref:Uncharacterized protein n=1 Tax=Karstenula rhodostoma CBS 690.94 TaxID=1392251 RepID=A0A9P4P6U7_9PLEO|nr:hypothetical protein P171DRAFT_449832 [Karstenula rhodostoma CBS 690.94]
MEQYRDTSFARIDDLATSTGGNAIPFSAILGAWEDAACEYEASIAFEQLRTVDAKKVVFEHAIANVRVSKYIQRLTKSAWALSVDNLAEAFGYASLMEPSFARNLVRLARRAGHTPWATVLAAIQTARDARRSSVNSRDQPTGAKWLAEDVAVAADALELPIDRRGPTKRQPKSSTKVSPSHQARKAANIPHRVPSHASSPGSTTNLRKRVVLGEISI